MNIDLTGKVNFQTQFDPIFGDISRQRVACARASKYMIQKAGFKTVDGAGRIDMVVKDFTGKLVKASTFDKALENLNTMLQSGKPVLVGVNRGKTSVGNANKATTHFVVVVGRTEINGKVFYRFYDPGTIYHTKGTNSRNEFYFDENGFLSGKSFYNREKCTYVITETRPTL